MTAIFEMPIGSETLTANEIELITGCVRRADQIAWLQAEGWTFFKNKAGDPIVGRLYARLKLSGINPNSMMASGGWAPDLNKVR